MHQATIREGGLEQCHESHSREEGVRRQAAQASFPMSSSWEATTLLTRRMALVRDSEKKHSDPMNMDVSLLMR